jgi:hypothetical protein
MQTVTQGAKPPAWSMTREQVRVTMLEGGEQGWWLPGEAYRVAATLMNSDD